MKKYLFPLFISLSLFSQESENNSIDEKVEELVVIGTKASIVSAIEKQRKSNLIVSVVDSDALGDFPDTTAAEAIRRLSGITVEMICAWWVVRLGTAWCGNWPAGSVGEQEKSSSMATNKQQYFHVYTCIRSQKQKLACNNASYIYGFNFIMKEESN